MDFFCILGGNFLKHFLNFWGNFLEHFWKFFWNFFRGFFWRNILGGIFGRNFWGGFFWEKFFDRNFFREEFFGRNSLFTLLKSFEYERDWFVCQNFGEMKKEGELQAHCTLKNVERFKNLTLVHHLWSGQHKNYWRSFSSPVDHKM